jgi:hypothetical protein
MKARKIALRRLGDIFPSDVAERIERAFYAKMSEETPLDSPDFTATYKKKFRALHANLSNPEFAGLAASVLSGDWSHAFLRVDYD